MNGKGYLLVLCLAAFGCAQSPTQQSAAPAKATLSKAANPDLPPGVPGWKQGMSDAQASSPLAPHAAKMTVTPESEIPVSSLKAPPGFKVEIWASGMPGVRHMTRGDRGTGRRYRRSSPRGMSRRASSPALAASSRIPR